MDSIEKLSGEVETVNGFCYLGNRLNAFGVRIYLMRFRERQELLFESKFSLKLNSLSLFRKISDNERKPDMVF